MDLSDLIACAAVLVAVFSALYARLAAGENRRMADIMHRTYTADNKPYVLFAGVRVVSVEQGTERVRLGLKFQNFGKTPVVIRRTGTRVIVKRHNQALVITGGARRPLVSDQLLPPGGEVEYETSEIEMAGFTPEGSVKLEIEVEYESPVLGRTYFSRRGVALSADEVLRSDITSIAVLSKLDTERDTA